MADRFKLRRGPKNSIDLNVYELGYATDSDEERLYFNNGSMVPIPNNKDITDIKTELTETTNVTNKNKQDVSELKESVAGIIKTGVAKLVQYSYDIELSENTKKVNIPYERYSSVTDTLKVYVNGLAIQNDQYAITDPVENDGIVTNGYIVLKVERPAGTIVRIEVWKNVPSGEEGEVSGNIIAKNTLPLDRIIGINDITTQLNDIMNKSISEFSKRLALGNITRIKLIGDSITEGQGSSDTLTSTDKVILVDGSKTYYETDHNHKCWANYFRDYVSRVSPSTEFLNWGIGGKTANYINSKKANLIDSNEDVVFVLLGTNDKFLTNNKPISDLKASLIDLLAYIELHSNLMIVLSPQTMNEYSDEDNTVMKTDIVNYTVEDIDRLTQQICIEKGYNFISLYKNFLKYCNDNKINYRYLLDNIGTNNPHPNDSGHELIWQIIQQNLNIPDIKKRGMLDKLYSCSPELLNGWSTPSNLNAPVIVARDKNTATINGIITGGSIEQGTVIATLPYQFRPNKQQNTYVKDWSNKIECVLSIKPNGNLIVGYNNNLWDNTKNTMLNFTYVLEV